jgi:hypothetical protein
MKLFIEATDQLTTIDGVPVRVWRGETEDGVPCLAFVHRIVVRDDEDYTRFERELVEKLPPGRHVPLRLVLP